MTCCVASYFTQANQSKIHFMFVLTSHLNKANTASFWCIVSPQFFVEHLQLQIRGVDLLQQGAATWCQVSHSSAVRVGCTLHGTFTSDSSLAYFLKVLCRARISDEQFSISPENVPCIGVLKFQQKPARKSKTGSDRKTHSSLIQRPPPHTCA